MAGMMLPFFARQTVTGGSGGAEGESVTCLSEPFDVTQYDSLFLELRVFGAIGTSVGGGSPSPSFIVGVEAAPDLYETDGSWKNLGTFTAVTLPQAPASLPSSDDLSVPTPFLRYVRIKAQILDTDDAAVTFQVTGIGRTSD